MILDLEVTPLWNVIVLNRNRQPDVVACDRDPAEADAKRKRRVPHDWPFLIFDVFAPNTPDTVTAWFVSQGIDSEEAQTQMADCLAFIMASLITQAETIVREEMETTYAVERN